MFVWWWTMSQCEHSKPAETLSSDKTTSAAGKVDSRSVRGRQEGGVHGTRVIMTPPSGGLQGLSADAQTPAAGQQL